PSTRIYTLSLHDALPISNRREAVLSDVLVIENEVIEDAHHRHDRRPGRILVDRHRGRAVPVIDPQGATLLLSRGGSRHAERQQQPEAHHQNPASLPHLATLPRPAFPSAFP